VPVSVPTANFVSPAVSRESLVWRLLSQKVMRKYPNHSIWSFRLQKAQSVVLSLPSRPRLSLLISFLFR
jgi:hypothetical protein